MLSILVGHAYFLRFDQKQFDRGKPYPPLATLQVAALLRKAGHEVALFDAMLASGVEDFKQVLQSVQPDLVLLYEDNFNFLSKMCLGKMRSAACEMISMAKSRHTRVIAAGSDASDAPEPYLKSGADAVLIGEGLSTLLALVHRLNEQRHIPVQMWTQGLPGVAAKKQGNVSSAAFGPLPAPEQPSLPAWDLIDMERYRSAWRRVHGYFSLNMAASRGCSFRCTWCAKPIWGNQYLQRAPLDVAAEMGYLKHTFAPDHIWFADDIFGFKVDWVERFAQALQAVDGSIPFMIQTRADLVSEGMANALRQAGCAEAWIGAESGSQRILDAMNKGITVTQLLTARTRLKENAIRTGFFIQLGYLDEQLEDILATRALLDQARPDDVGISVSYPLPGTKFYQLVEKQLGRKTRWQESNDLEMMFHGTYSSTFYRAVRNLLHEQVDLERTSSTDEREYHAARQRLEQRWCNLIENEQRYRQQPQHVAAH